MSSASSENAPGNNVDRVLFKNLVEMVPLVESLMDKRANSSFTRRASMVYTPTPSQLKKVNDPRGRKTVSSKKQRDLGDSIQKDNQDAADDVSTFSSRAEEDHLKERHELTMLRQQVNDLQKKLLEKEEALKYAKESLNQMNASYASVDELRHLISEKESLIKSTNSQLYNAKIMLADKQAALEKLQWEAKMSNRKVEELQDDVVSMELEVTALMQIFQELSNKDSVGYHDHDITYFDNFDPLPPLQDKVDEVDLVKMEEARTCYLAAVALAKEDPSDESLAAAAAARQRLQSFVF
ncbi:uncharacterized protein M6B38_116215 [Iris pallida]|uniref:Uncharacterized protein n=1 Tax=Iris pallida TaxID=29817 RepID=A0AAX6FDT2_IRIPA|nr:uncharacterized protein M6B38_141160 [Iris pallida]KAJ6848067.1 uncharacterized protein M6B38_116215 [Iris pallida]